MKKIYRKEAHENSTASNGDIAGKPAKTLLHVDSNDFAQKALVQYNRNPDTSVYGKRYPTPKNFVKRKDIENG